MTVDSDEVTVPSEQTALSEVRPPEKFAGAFMLPPGTSEELTSLYEEIVEDFRSESRHLPMNAVQTLLVERIAYFYIAMRVLESEQTRINPARLVEMTKQWKEMTTEFNKQLASSHTKQRTELLTNIATILEQALPLITDEKDRNEFRVFISHKFKELGE